MKQTLLTLTENWDRETKIVAALCGFSFVSHLMIFYFKDISWPSQPIQYEEWVIETDLAYNVDVKKAPPKETPEEKEIPNQLPSNFAVKSEVTDLQKASAVPEKKEEEKVEEEDPTKKAQEEQEKKDALVRLLKEEKQAQKAKLSQASRDSAEKKSVNELLKRQKQELMQRQGMGSSKAVSGHEGMHPYIGELRDWIMRFYQIPEIYAERFQDQEFPVLDVTIDAEGNVRKLTVFQASKEETLNQLAIKTVQDASPFPKPPAEFVGRVIRLPFHPSKR